MATGQLHDVFSILAAEVPFLGEAWPLCAAAERGLAWRATALCRCCRGSEPEGLGLPGLWFREVSDQP